MVLSYSFKPSISACIVTFLFFVISSGSKIYILASGLILSQMILTLSLDSLVPSPWIKLVVAMIVIFYYVHISMPEF